MEEKSQQTQHADNLLRFRLIMILLGVCGFIFSGLITWNLTTTLATHDAVIEHNAEIKNIQDQLRSIWDVLRPDEREPSRKDFSSNK